MKRITRLIAAMTIPALTLCLMLTFLSLQTQTVRGKAPDLPSLNHPGAPMSPLYSFMTPVVFAGNNNVDLAWGPVAGYSNYKVMRDGQQIGPTMPASNTFYRDNGVSKGETHTYQMCAYETEGNDYCGQETVVQVGDIAGEILQDLTWSAGEYELVFEVRVMPNTVLQTTGGVNVVPKTSSGNIKITDQPGGAIQINGAKIAIPVFFYNPDSEIYGSTLYFHRSIRHLWIRELGL